MEVQKATKRTFYIERYGESYNVVKVWNPGDAFTQKDTQDCLNRVMATEPDERIVAEQIVGISSTTSGVQVVAADPVTLQQTKSAMQQFLKGDKPK